MTTTLLLSSAGRRLYLVHALLDAVPDGGKLIVSDMDPLAPALHTGRADTYIPSSQDPAERAGELLAFCADRDVDAVLSLHDFEMVELAGRIADDGAPVRFIGPSAGTASMALDKVRLWEHARDHGGLGVPETYWDQRLPAEEVEEGWVLKDRWGSASSGLSFAGDLSEVRDRIRGRARTHEPALVAQPRLLGEEYNVDVFVSDSGIAGACVKRKLGMRAGETDRARVLLEPPPHVLDAALRVVRTLDATGNIDIDVIDVDGRAEVIDVNPRFGGRYAFSLLAGYDAATAVWQLAAGADVAPLAPLRDITAGKFVSAMEYTS